MVGFSVESTEEIKRLYKKKKAIDLGAPERVTQISVAIRFFACDIA